MKFMVALDTGSDLFWVPCAGTRFPPVIDNKAVSILRDLSSCAIFVSILF